MVHSGYTETMESWTGMVEKGGRFIPISKLDMSLQNLCLQNPSKPVKTGGLSESEVLINDHLEEDNGLFEDCCFPGNEEPTAVELRSPVEGSSISELMGKAGKGSKLNSPLGSSFTNQDVISGNSISLSKSTPSPVPEKPKVGSQPIDIVSPRGSGNKMSKAYKKSNKIQTSVRENLLAEAWERKRDQTLHDERSVEKEKRGTVTVSRCVSDCGKGGSTPSGLGVKTRSRTRSLTDDDFDELRGCIDLGFGFSQDYDPDLCDTLPALEVCYAISQKRYDSQGCSSPLSSSHNVSESQSPGASSSQSPISPWRISSPGDHPQQVKARLRHWAQAVACSVRQCS